MIRLLALISYLMIVYLTCFSHQILETVGDGAVAFGRDTGRNTEGRRNHIDSYKYKAEDGTNRLRIRMNIKGSRGQVRVWAEVIQVNNLAFKHNKISMCL